MDYSELVKALRCKRGDCEGCDLAFFDKDEGWMCQYAAKDDDAADAIEELKDMPWVESVQVDKLRQRIDELEETACHCNVKENAELIAKILDDDVDGKVYQMPKRGEIVRCRECRWGHLCVMGQHLGLDGFCSKGEREAQIIKSVTMREGDTDTDGFFRKAVEAVTEVLE